VITDYETYPKTVIIKQPSLETDSFLYERITFDFLQEQAPHLIPQIYGYDKDNKIIILEDLGDTKQALLGEILFREDRAFATETLLKFNQALADLHLSTVDKKNIWDNLTIQHGRPSRVSRHRINHIIEAMVELPNHLKILNIRLNDYALADLTKAIECISNPQQFLALVHGDSTPSNAMLVEGNIRLFDFETSNFRHCLLDGSFSRMRYLHSVWARKIPLDIQQESMQRYRDILLANHLTDEATFDEHFTASCVAWLAGLFALLPSCINKDKRWGRSTNRQRIVTGLQHFMTVADELGHYQHLRDVCVDTEQSLKRLWSDEDCTMALYPAFID
ncbi:MAG: hypothetical protein WBC91_06915, partial [Phototrophicaceae bacterium]